MKLPAAAFNDYLEYIKSFPLNDDPSLFGMHSNADISYAQVEAYACLTTLLNMQPRKLATQETIATTSMEEVTSQITLDMLSTISAPFDLMTIQTRYQNSSRIKQKYISAFESLFFNMFLLLLLRNIK